MRLSNNFAKDDRIKMKERSTIQKTRQVRWPAALKPGGIVIRLADALALDVGAGLSRALVKPSESSIPSILRME